MLEKPALPDESLVACLRDGYSLNAVSLEFLPWGYDSNAGVYHVLVEDGSVCFLKVKRIAVNPAGLLVPYYLHRNGVPQVLAPLPTMNQDLFITIEDFTLILYPYIAGKQALEVGLLDLQWLELGDAMHRVHTVPLTDQITGLIKSETFVLRGSQLIADLRVVMESG